MIENVLAVFEGEEAKRLFWILPLSLGYTYTKTGSVLDFVLAVLSIGSVRLALGLIDMHDESAPDSEVSEVDIALSLNDEHFSIQTLLSIAFIFIFFLSVAYAPWRLYNIFDHSDPIIVGFSGAFLAVLVVLATPD